MALRCVYTDLDGTLLGAGASLFRDGEGGFTLLPARALEACHRAGVEVVLKSGRRKAQVMEDARLIGQSAYIYEIGSGVVIEDEEHFLCGPYAPRDGLSPHELIGDAGAPELLERSFGDAIEPHCAVAPRPLRVPPLPRHGWTSARPTRCSSARATATCGWWTTARSRTGARCTTWSPPRPRRRPGWSCTCARGATSPSSASRWATRSRTWGWPRWWARFFMVANGPQASGANVERTESSHGDGFYEAVVRSLVT